MPAKPSSVIVVGGGLAGIATSLTLAKKNIPVTLLEGRRRLGGRVGSFVAKGENGEETEIDYCQHVGMGCCTNLKQLIAWLGQEKEWQEHRQLHVYGPTGQYQKLSAIPWVPQPLHLAGWLWKWPGLCLRDRISAARGLLAIRRLKLDDDTAAESAIQWLRSVGQTKSAIQNLWKTIVVSALGEELERVSLAAVGKVLQDGFLNRRDAFHLLVPKRPLGELFGRQAQEHLRLAGVDVRLGTSVDAISDVGCGAFSVRSGKRLFQARGLVLAIPWHQIPKLSVPENRLGMENVISRARQLQSSPVTGVHTWWDRPWLSKPHAVIVGRLCQWVFPKPNGIPNSDSKCQIASDRTFYYQVIISGSRALGDRPVHEIATVVHDDLAAVFPCVRAAKLLRFKMVTDPQAVFSISPQASRLRPDSTVAGNLLLAGDWTNTGWPATMEGAILSGFRAADKLLENWNTKC